MKKLLSTVCVMAIAITVALSGVIVAFASSPYEDACDTAFYSALDKVLEEENVTEEIITIQKEPIYDLTLNQLGYIYNLQISDSQNGYALAINTNGIFEVTEIFLNAESPYAAYAGQKIYVSAFFYLVYADGRFTETSSGAVLDDEALNTLSEKAFYGADKPLVDGQESIYYTNKSTNKRELAKRHPAYLPVGVTNGCTPTAGANLVGYYTHFFPELIPGFTPGSYMGNYFLYIEMADEVLPVISTLYNYMGTNTVEPGTTIDGFVSGMTRYCNEKGRNISFSSNMQNGTFNYNLIKQRFENGLPAALFVDTFTVSNFYPYENEDVIQYTIGSVCHTMAGFGYNEVTYTLTNGQTRVDKYITVATALNSPSKGYFNVNTISQIDEALSVTVY